MLLLTITAVSFTSCEDDDDILGVDLNDDGTLFISSNTSGLVSVLDTRDSDNREIMTFTAEGMDSDGIYFDEANSLLYQVNRSDNNLVQYEDVLDDINDSESINRGLISAAGAFSNGRGLAVVGNTDFYVAQDGDDNDEDDMSQIVLFTRNANALDRVATWNVPFNLWGIQADGTTLYAVVDNTDSVAVFTSINDAADGTTVTADRFIKVDGIVRTHGLEYYPEDDLMLLTDIGSAGSDTDGAIFVIKNFSTLTGNTISAANYTKISGPATLLGNPVDVAYDEDGERIYVAERANGGGRLLSFDLNASGDTAPKSNDLIPGISSLYLNND